MNPEDPPLLVRIWLCISAPKRWAKRRKIDKAGTTLFNDATNDEEMEIACQLHNLSNRLWTEEFSRYTKAAK